MTKWTCDTSGLSRRWWVQKNCSSICTLNCPPFVNPNSKYTSEPAHGLPWLVFLQTCGNLKIPQQSSHTCQKYMNWLLKTWICFMKKKKQHGETYCWEIPESSVLLKYSLCCWVICDHTHISITNLNVCVGGACAGSCVWPGYVFFTQSVRRWIKELLTGLNQ